MPLHQFCALTECMRLLLAAMEVQYVQYATGNTAPVREVWVLLQLHEVIRAGICAKTRVLESAEMPGISGLLRQLPPSWEKWLTAAIVAEMSGDVRHLRTSMPPAVQIILREPEVPVATARRGRHFQSKHSGYPR